MKGGRDLRAKSGTSSEPGVLFSSGLSWTRTSTWDVSPGGGEERYHKEIYVQATLGGRENVGSLK